MNKLDPFTFGKSMCAINLAAILDELGDKRVTANVSKLLSNFSKRGRDLCMMNFRSHKLTCRDFTSTKQLLLSLLYKHYQDKINITYRHWPLKVRTHCLNLLKAKHYYLLNY